MSIILRPECCSEFDYRNEFMVKDIKLISSARVYPNNGYSEFTTFFRIPFKNNPEDVVFPTYSWEDVIGCWADTCIRALEMRMDSCVAMLFRNRENVIFADEYTITFKKANGTIHSFNHPSFQVMENLVQDLKQKDWKSVRTNKAGIRQLQKALYWISEEERKDHGLFSFGQLISFLDECTL